MGRRLRSSRRRRKSRRRISEGTCLFRAGRCLNFLRMLLDVAWGAAGNKCFYRWILDKNQRCVRISALPPPFSWASSISFSFSLPAQTEAPNLLTLGFVTYLADLGGSPLSRLAYLS
eukprot:5118811-Pyramimonas_sp.AAC.1